jgi:hypothetical protein
MKSLLRTLPRVQTVELWGVRAWTNLEMLEELFSTPSPMHPIVHKLASLFSDIEMHDARVGTTSILLQRGKMTLKVYPKRGHGTQAKAQEHYVDLIGCQYCQRTFYPGTEKKEASHEKGCILFLAIEVMES